MGRAIQSIFSSTYTFTPKMTSFFIQTLKMSGIIRNICGEIYQRTMSAAHMNQHVTEMHQLNSCLLSFGVLLHQSCFGRKANAKFPRFYSRDDRRPRNQQSGVHFTAMFPFTFWAGGECIDTKPSVVVLKTNRRSFSLMSAMG